MLSPEVFRNRRLRLAHEMKEGVAVIPTASEHPRNGDVLFPFRPDSYFYYLTGFSEPEAVLVVVAGASPRSILFCREKNSREEMWTGCRMGPEKAENTLGIEEAYPISFFTGKMKQLLSEKKTLYLLSSKIKESFLKVDSLQFAMQFDESLLSGAPKMLLDAGKILDAMRLVKDKEEIELMRQAAEITRRAHERAMRTCRPGIMEYELEAELSYEFRKSGADPLHAYPAIVAGGENACILHYTENNKRLRDGDLVLIDAGCEWGRYASDVTRTFPVNGSFSKEQKVLYEIVLHAQEAAIEKVRAGNKFFDPHRAACRTIATGLMLLGILPKENLSPSAHAEEYRFLREHFFMHRTSHFLGLDVHDVGEVTGALNQECVLKPGMVVTVEPGIYISKEDKTVDEKWRGIGIRIEDDVVVTQGDPEILTRLIPKTVFHIERAMSMRQ